MIHEQQDIVVISRNEHGYYIQFWENNEYKINDFFRVFWMVKVINLNRKESSIKLFGNLKRKEL